jgi:hypothetical protein
MGQNFGVFGAVPACADPPVPPLMQTRCSRDPGGLTCVDHARADLYKWGLDNSEHVVRGLTGAQICLSISKINTGRMSFAVEMSSVLLTESVFTTTTTERFGLKGEILETSSTTSPLILTRSRPPGCRTGLQLHRRAVAETV